MDNRKYLVCFGGYQLFSATTMHQLRTVDQLLTTLLNHYARDISGEYLIKHTTKCLYQAGVIDNELYNYIQYMAFDSSMEVPVFDMILDQLRSWVQ